MRSFRHLFADLYPIGGGPVEVVPWRLALVLVMQYMKGLTTWQSRIVEPRREHYVMLAPDLKKSVDPAYHSRSTLVCYQQTHA